MSLAALATTAETTQLTAQVAAVYDYLATNVEPKLATVGKTVPAVEAQALPWVKLFSDGTSDATFCYHDSNWFTRSPYQIGHTAIFLKTATMGAGWTSTLTGTIGLTPGSQYEWREFTGAGLLLKGQWAYRRFDQSPAA